MGRRQKKCPACGLANFRDSVQCQWCALALRDRARNELVDDAPPVSRGPWGAMLIMLAVASICGGIVWHVTRKAVVRAEQLVNEQLEPAPAKTARRTGPPSLSGRSPSDPALRQMEEASEQLRREMEEENERLRREMNQYGGVNRRTDEEQMRRMMEEQRARQREIEERVREAEGTPDTPDER